MTGIEHASLVISTGRRDLTLVSTGRRGSSPWIILAFYGKIVGTIPYCQSKKGD
ncbi:MAG: hypothetical protein ABID79_03755 [Elusimicrobiota bacterium]